MITRYTTTEITCEVIARIRSRVSLQFQQNDPGSKLIKDSVVALCDGIIEALLREINSHNIQELLNAFNAGRMFDHHGMWKYKNFIDYFNDTYGKEESAVKN